MDFEVWLSQRLLELKTDAAVFGPYIKSILSDEDQDEKIEGLDGLLSELGDPSLDVESFRTEIMTRWKNQLEQNGESADSLDEKTQEIKTEGTHQLSLDEHLEKLLQLSPEELGASGTDKGKGAGADSDLRAAILKQYQEVDSDIDEETGAPKPSTKLDGLDRNTNAERVLNAQKEIREKAKADAAKKREKDKEDRAKQKKLAEEKKEKAKKKTAKVERKR